MKESMGMPISVLGTEVPISSSTAERVSSRKNGRNKTGLDSVKRKIGNAALAANLAVGVIPPADQLPTKQPHTPAQERPTEQLPAPVYSAPPFGFCLDSFGNHIRLGEARPQNDDCVAIKMDTPQLGDITYIFQPEPSTDAAAQEIRVIRNANGTLRWVVGEPGNMTAALQAAAESAPAAKIGLLARLRASYDNYLAIQKPQPPAAQPLVSAPMPAQAQAPQATASPRLGIFGFLERTQTHTAPDIRTVPASIFDKDSRTLEWYSLISEVSVPMNYDPRTHLLFVEIESRGNPNAHSNTHLTKRPDIQAHGLIQIIPGTWGDIRAYIYESDDLKLIAKKLDIDYLRATPYDPKANIFFSSVYLIHFCGFPTGYIPAEANARAAYTAQVADAARRYHDGPENPNSPNAYSLSYMADIYRMLPAIVVHP